MSIAAAGATYGRRRAVRIQLLSTVLATLGLLAIAGFLGGRALAPAATASDPIERVGGIPVGVEHSPSGALAAADNYVGVSYDTVERSPARDSQLINAVYAPGIRAGAIRGAAAVRKQDPAAMRLWRSGGQNLSLIGARRLDYYSGDYAQVTTWNADVFWGRGRAPKQAWVLTQTSLRWSGGRWLVSGTSTLPTAGPVPALTPQATSSNDSTAAFHADLAGYSSPAYGAAG